METAGREHESYNHAVGERIIFRIKQVCRTTTPTCFWIPVVSSPTCLWWKRGPVDHFLGASATKKRKVDVSKPAPIHGEHQSPAQWPRHTRAFSGKQNWFSNRSPLPDSTQTYNRTKQHPTDLHKANLFTLTQTNKRQATDQPKLSPCQNNRVATQAKILSIGGPKIKDQKRNQLGRPSTARPVSLVFLDPKMKATNSAENAIHLWIRQWPSPRPSICQEWLSAKHTWNALAQVWSAPFEEAPGTTMLRLRFVAFRWSLCFLGSSSLRSN